MKTKKFDSVKMMREIRENLSKDISALSVKEKIALFEKELPQLKRNATKASDSNGIGLLSVAGNRIERGHNVEA